MSLIIAWDIGMKKMKEQNIIWAVDHFSALLHFRPPPIVIDDSSWKNAAESFTVALTLTIGGYKSAIAPIFL